MLVKKYSERWKLNTLYFEKKLCITSMIHISNIEQVREYHRPQAELRK